MENKNQPIKITIEQGDKQLQLTTHWDSELEDWEQVFRVILKWLTFTNEQANELFNKNEFGEELEEENNKEAK